MCEAKTLFPTSMSSLSSLSSTKQLIQMMYAHPELWDRTNRQYRDKFAKDRAWLNIYRELEPTYDVLSKPMQRQIGAQIMKKWYNVRDSYVKSKKGTSYKRKKPYIYTEEMSFLDPVIGFTKEEPDGDDNYNTTDDNTKGRHSNDEDYNDMPSEHFLDEVFIEMEDHDENGPKRVKQDKSRVESDENIVTILANLIQKEEDEDRAFFKSITPSVKSMTDESRFEFRIKVMELIKELKAKDKKKVNRINIKVRPESDVELNDIDDS